MKIVSRLVTVTFSLLAVVGCQGSEEGELHCNEVQCWGPSSPEDPPLDGFATINVQACVEGEERFYPVQAGLTNIEWETPTTLAWRLEWTVYDDDSGWVSVTSDHFEERVVDAEDNKYGYSVWEDGINGDGRGSQRKVVVSLDELPAEAWIETEISFVQEKLPDHHDCDPQPSSGILLFIAPVPPQ